MKIGGVNMIKENAVHIILSAVIAGISAYFEIIAVPIIMLIVVMVIDYFTGLEGAYVNKQLNSRIGIIGIIKKISYLGLVAVGMVIDYVIKSALTQVGVNIDFGYCIGMLIVIWLIINELISILENLAEIGVPLPKFITKIVDRLKSTIEDKAE